MRKRITFGGWSDDFTISKMNTLDTEFGKFHMQEGFYYNFNLTEEQEFALMLIDDRDKAYQYCEMLLKKRNTQSIEQNPNARMDESLLNEIEELKNINKYYYQFEIPKASGGVRIINAPEDHLKEMQRRVVFYLRDIKLIQESDNAYAYVKGRSHKMGADVHADAKSYYYSNFDLEKFFPSITPKLLKNALKKYDLTEREINAIIKVSTWYDKDNGKVCFPQGSVTSPYLSNIVFKEIDHKIVSMLENKFDQEMVYTRYSDDITISCKKSYARGKLLWSLLTLLESYGFKLNESKTKFTTIMGKNKVTGLTVNKHYKVTVGHKRKKWLKSTYHKTIKLVISGIATLDEVYSMLGELSYLYSVEPDYHKYIVARYNKLFKKDVYAMCKQYTS